jgi:flavin reductase (DIM6/NTAB) family NADH-FMN oxidoreductase RutF
MTKQTVTSLTPTRVLDLLPPYPIVLVTTRTNIITVNQIVYFTFAPLRIGIGIAHARYTYGLLKAEGAFVVNVPGPELVDAVKRCGSLSGRTHDKFAAAGLDPEPWDKIDAVGIRQCGAQIACRVERELVFDERTWFIGEVVAARRREGHRGTEALMCGRHDYRLPGAVVSGR